MAIPIETIKLLRQETGAGILDCRKALDESGLDFDKALARLRELGMAAATKRADRPALQGVIEVYSHGDGQIGVIVEINTETDFTGKSQAFRSFAHEIALQIAASHPQYVRDEDIPGEVIEAERQKAAKNAHDVGKSESLIPRIVEGSLKKYKDRNVLLRQPYIRDESLSIEQLLNQLIAAVGENVIIRRFTRWQLEEEGSLRPA